MPPSWISPLPHPLRQPSTGQESNDNPRWRHLVNCQSQGWISEKKRLKRKVLREKYQNKQRNEILDDLKKVRRSYTGHYDASKSPIENIQSALKQQCLTPLRSSRLDVPNANPIRKARSMESLPVVKPTKLASGGSEIHKRAKSVHLAKKPVSPRLPK